MSDGSFIDFSGELDPAVDALLRDAERRERERKLPPRERKKRARERAKIRERRARRVTYDLPPDLRRRLAAIAEEQGIPASQLVTWLLLRGLEDLGDTAAERTARLRPYKAPSRSPRYEWNLLLEGEG